MNRTLIALMLSTFALGLSEFMPMGLLPVIAEDLSISIPKAGLLITAYAMGVMIASPIMTLLLSPLSKKRALIILMGIFTMGSFFSLTAPGYTSLVFSRILTSLAHGSFFGLGAILAISLTPKEKQAGVVSLVFMGLTIANIGGVPLASWVGEIMGWRTAFLATTVLGLVAAITLVINIPAGENGNKVNVRREVKALIQPAVLVIFLGTTLFATSLFTLYTYIAVVLQTLASATPAFVALMLSCIGIGFTLGGLISNKLAIYWSIDKAIALSFCVAAATLMLYPFVATSYAGAAVMTLLWATAGYIPSPLLQTKIVKAAKDAPALASSVNIGIFNLGNALGAVIGGAVITLGMGYTWIAPVGGVIALLGMFSILPALSKRNALEKSLKINQGVKHGNYYEI